MGREANGREMKAFVVLAGVVLTIHVALLGIAVGEGCLLHGLFRSLSVGEGALLGALATIGEVLFFLKLFGLFASIPSLAEAETEDDEEGR